MIEIVSTKDKERLAARLQCIRERNVALDSALISYVASILSEVRLRGDAALVDYAAQFDGCQVKAADLRVNEDVLRQIATRAENEVVRALREAICRVRAFHEHEREMSWAADGPNGVQLGQRITPIERVGLYVPGGTASYPSSVVMNVIPAQVAGVDRIIVATPPGALKENPAVAAALVELNVLEVYATGGAQAIAALAYGTKTVPKVDKITGPGNRYVAAAKKLVFGIVGIDSLAGPSEVIVIADETARPSYVASDLLAQAEHSEDAAAILVTTSEKLAVAVGRELLLQLSALSRAAVIEKSLSQYGTVIIAKDMEEACVLVNELAPEHLEIMARDESVIAARITNVGAIFFGEHTPAVVGDYLAGPNHVLPTSGAARFSSALSVHDFVKRTSTVKFSVEELQKTAQMIGALARSERLDAHSQSALIRLR